MALFVAILFLPENIEIPLSHQRHKYMQFSIKHDRSRRPLGRQLSIIHHRGLVNWVFVLVQIQLTSTFAAQIQFTSITFAYNVKY